jgi:hypothetical protein
MQEFHISFTFKQFYAFVVPHVKKLNVSVFFIIYIYMCVCVCVCVGIHEIYPMLLRATYHKLAGRELGTLAADVHWNLIDFRAVILGRLCTLQISLLCPTLYVLIKMTSVRTLRINFVSSSLKNCRSMKNIATSGL